MFLIRNYGRKKEFVLENGQTITFTTELHRTENRKVAEELKKISGISVVVRPTFPGEKESIVVEGTVKEKVEDKPELVKKYKGKKQGIPVIYPEPEVEKVEKNVGREDAI